MRPLFADAFYFVAILDPRDEDHLSAKRFPLGRAPAITSDLVLTEVLNYLSAGRKRNVAAEAATAWVTSTGGIKVIHHDKEMYLAAIRFYQRRPDKAWSLTDCASFLIMDRLRIQEALTADHHFEQAGYTALFKQQ